MLLCGAALLATAKAHAVEADEGLVSGLRLSIEALPALDSRPLPATSTSLEPTRSGEIDSRLWVGRGRASLGFGLNTLTHGDAAFSSMTVGVRYRLSDAAGLTLVSSARSLSPNGRLEGERDVRLGFELKPSRPAGQFSRGTIFRAQLSADTQVSLRLRGGGLRLVLRSEF